MRRRAHQFVLVLYIFAVLGCVAMVLGPALNDRTINQNPGRALATVVNVGTIRTSVEYQGDDGRLHSPKAGLLYPSGLGEGQRVWVTYAKDNYDLVKVEGRRWTLAFIPALSCLAVASAIAAGLWLLVSRWPARRRPQPPSIRKPLKR
ncbi:DUF3592 domain-containing protein [Corynebacterium gerontici]|uniref:DUF3592 domain-containing protein n=1 Tax=Corynebacterium gerontici TaxID=2079234 RepID=UPI000F4D4667|nr:DUF3592 domain-containing protein [Corynebacterium gerontici]